MPQKSTRKIRAYRCSRKKLKSSGEPSASSLGSLPNPGGSAGVMSCHTVLTKRKAMVPKITTKKPRTNASHAESQRILVTFETVSFAGLRGRLVDFEATSWSIPMNEPRAACVAGEYNCGRRL